MKKVLVFLSFLVFACGNSNEETIVQDITTTTVQESTTTTVTAETSKEFELPYKHNFYELENCNDFLGSSHNIICFDVPQIEKIFKFESPIVNLTKSRNKQFAISKDGIVYDLDIEKKEFEIIFDIRGQVFLESLESGLLSFFLHPDKDEFLISYINKNNELVFELFYFENEIQNKKASETLLNVPIFSVSHYAGNIFWSDYYAAYLVSIGDGVEANFESRLNHTPLVTNEYYGKIVALSGDGEFKKRNNLVLSGKNEVTKTNIIASGLRNPWQFFEFEDFLIVADTGFTQNEELNIYKYTTTIPIFGWPVFEATKRSEDLDSIENYSLDSELYFWGSNGREDGLNYVEQNSIMPAFYYNHLPCYSEKNENCFGQTDIYRAAIIGGDILSDINSDYNFDIYFADYLSQELFSLNLITRDVKIFPIPGITSVTSIKVNYGKNDEIIATSYDGSIYLIKLP